LHVSRLNGIQFYPKERAAHPSRAAAPSFMPAVFFLTGRPEAQREHAAGNLVKVG
jgi:hypothetical protein